MTVRKWLIGAACAAMLAGALPQEGVSGPIDGDFLLMLATSGAERHENAYFMYVVGVADAFMMTTEAIGTDKFFCVSEVSIEDMGSAVRIWMRNNKDALKVEGVVVVFEALSKHFPCE